MSWINMSNWINMTNGTNYTANGTTAPAAPQRCLPTPLSEAAAVSLTVAYAVVFLVALLGNSIVIHVVRIRLTSRVPFNLLIVNMAACDIIYAFAAVPFGIHFIWVRVLWFRGGFGEFLCKFKEFALVVSIATSVLTLGVMSVDRYLAIVHVLKRPLSRKNVFVTVAIVWVVSCLLSSGELVKMKSIEYMGKPVCVPIWSFDPQKSLEIGRAEFNIKFITLYAVPLVTMVIFYSFIIRFLWLRKVPGVKNDENDRKVKKQGQKVVLMLVTMVTVFAVGWLPVHVTHYMISYTNMCPLPTSVPLFMIWLAHANCAINPCLYVIFNSSFKEEFRRLVAKYCLKGIQRTWSSVTVSGSTRTLHTTVIRPHASSTTSYAGSSKTRDGNSGSEYGACTDTRL